MWFVLAYHVYTTGFLMVYNYFLVYAEIFAVLFGLNRLSLGFPLYSQCGTPRALYTILGRGTPKQYPPRNETE